MKPALLKAEALAQIVCGSLLSIIFASMVVVGGIQVFGRFLFNFTPSWAEEFQRYGQAWLVFLAIPFAYARAFHIAMTFLTKRLPLGVRRSLAVLVDLSWAGLGLILVMTGARIMSLGMIQKSPGMGASMALVYSVIVISGTYTTLLALRRLVIRDDVREEHTLEEEEAL